MSESLRNDGQGVGSKNKGDKPLAKMRFLKTGEIISLRKYPSYDGNLTPRDIASRAAKEVCDDGFRSRGPGGYGVYLDFAGRHKSSRRTEDA